MNTCFLDRDGVLIEEENYLSDPAKVRLCPGAAKALRLLKDHDCLVIVTSNQSGIARGYFSWEELYAVERRIKELLTEEDAPLPDAWFYCPHHPKGTVPEFAIDCSCRKPKPGMLLKAEENLPVTKELSFMIGDKISDLKAAFAFGCPRAALVLTGHGAEQKQEKLERNYLVADGILDAVERLLA